MSEPQPIFCACGAQWHGKFTDSPVIADHRRRGAGDAPNRVGCRIVSHETFKSTHTCQCAECKPPAPKRQPKPRLPSRSALQARLAQQQSASRQLIVKFREGAEQAGRWKVEADAQHDGANVHAFRKERRIWTTCADALEAAILDAAERPK